MHLLLSAKTRNEELFEIFAGKRSLGKGDIHRSIKIDQTSDGQFLQENYGHTGIQKAYSVISKRTFSGSVNDCMPVIL